MAADVRVGFEVDGTQVTVVTVSDGTVADVRAFREPSLDESLRLALASVRRTDPIRAVLAGGGGVVTRLDITADTLDRSRFETLARSETRLPAEGTTVSGILFDVTGVTAGLLGSGVAAVAPADPVERLYAALGERAEIVPAPFTSATVEGISLALRHSCADLTLVVDGQPVAFAVLPSGGLATVEAVLGGGTGAGAERLTAALSGGAAAADPLATAQLERYLRAVLVDVRDTIEEWARRGEPVTREVFIHGIGARARTLDLLIGDAGLARVPQPALTQALVHLPPAERPAAVGAYLAAATHGRDLPTVAFPNPATVAKYETQERRRVRRRRARVLGAAAGVMLLGLAGPAAFGQIDHVLAQRQLAAATDHLNSLGANAKAFTDLSTREQAVRSFASLSAWDTVIPRTESAARAAHVTPESVTVQTEGGDLILTVNGSYTAPTAQPLTDFYGSLREQLRAFAFTAGPVTARPDGGADFSVTFHTPGGAR